MSSDVTLFNKTVLAKDGSIEEYWLIELRSQESFQFIEEIGSVESFLTFNFANSLFLHDCY